MLVLNSLASNGIMDQIHIPNGFLPSPHPTLAQVQHLNEHLLLLQHCSLRSAWRLEGRINISVAV